MDLTTTTSIEVARNEEGYLLDPAQWTEAIAEAIARESSITLTPDHWTSILEARRDFFESGQSPGLRRLSSKTKLPIKRFYELFPGGPGKLIAKVAGIPKPKSCL